MPTHRLCVFTTKSRFYSPTDRTKNRWRSVDAHFQDGAGSVFLTLLPIKHANTLIMCIHYQVAFLLPDLHDQQSMTLQWRSFSRWGGERVAFFLPSKGCQNFYYVYSLPKCAFITRLTAPKIVDAPLMLILPWAHSQYIMISFGGKYH